MDHFLNRSYYLEIQILINMQQKGCGFLEVFGEMAFSFVSFQRPLLNGCQIINFTLGHVLYTNGIFINKKSWHPMTLLFWELSLQVSWSVEMFAAFVVLHPTAAGCYLNNLENNLDFFSMLWKYE